nr:response regulator transcription factor [uncultured Dyadobacter sp.]
MHADPIKTVLVHPNPIEREALCAWLRQQSMVVMTGHASDLSPGSPLLTEAEMVLIFDYGLPALPAQIISLKRSNPRLKFMVFHDSRSLSNIRDVICAGVHGYIDLASETGEWYEALHAVANGRVFYGQRIILQLAMDPVEMQDRCAPEASEQALSAREMEILGLVAREYSTSRIATKLFISVKTVETHRRNLFQKLHVKNVVGLTKAALRMGVLE